MPGHPRRALALCPIYTSRIHSSPPRPPHAPALIPHSPIPSPSGPTSTIPRRARRRQTNNVPHSHHHCCAPPPTASPTLQRPSSASTSRHGPFSLDTQRVESPRFKRSPIRYPLVNVKSSSFTRVDIRHLLCCFISCGHAALDTFVAPRYWKRASSSVRGSHLYHHQDRSP